MCFVPIRARRPSAPAARQMLVGETGDGNLVYVNQVELFPLCPPEEMAGAVGVAVDGLPRIPALDQVPPERLNVRRVLRLSANARKAFDTICRIHRGLLEARATMVRRTSKLCGLQLDPTPPAPRKATHSAQHPQEGAHSSEVSIEVVMLSSA